MQNRTENLSIVKKTKKNRDYIAFFIIFGLNLFAFLDILEFLFTVPGICQATEVRMDEMSAFKKDDMQFERYRVYFENVEPHLKARTPVLTSSLFISEWLH